VRPHLRDLRSFVDECEGLPDDILVRIDKGYLGEDGRQNVTISLTYNHPSEASS